MDRWRSGMRRLPGMLQHLVLKDSVLRHPALRHPALRPPILSAAALIMVSAGSGAVLAPSAAAATSTPITSTATTPATSTSAPAASPPPPSPTSPPTATISTPIASTTGTGVPTTTSTPSPTASSPGPATTASLSVPTLTLPGPKKAIPWPSHGRARLEVAALGVLGHSGSSARSVPIASVTKVMTAYVILRDHPLAAGQDGPTIVVTTAEAASYARRKAAGESLVKVAAGEKINERQALQGLLLASGNNMADILGRWDAGGTHAFVARMNRTARLLGLTSTHYADASGLDARSRSSATDLLTLAPAAMADPTFAEIVAQTSATIPHNKLKNTNRL